jgi:hypothetical protein
MSSKFDANLREELMLIVFEQSAEKISVPRTEEVTYDGEN